MEKIDHDKFTSDAIQIDLYDSVESVLETASAEVEKAKRDGWINLGFEIKNDYDSHNFYLEGYRPRTEKEQLDYDIQQRDSKEIRRKHFELLKKEFEP